MWKFGWFGNIWKFNNCLLDIFLIVLNLQKFLVFYNKKIKNMYIRFYYFK